ncbi:heavy metal translocating P-type ATPase [Pelagibacterium sp. H642]|uniref:heavy metal translocating P-type ATPase n=1 Tax=Pelagibacterium sp. H642 TaxID=1881069 RepID=UPI0028152C6D|nr:heavy metal translocating P-type ATPase [Pelagibacterium sp. H642]WMT90250.1 heavy metal translocating P-type ATPase [Pelagibacterium sp. H642]
MTQDLITTRLLVRGMDCASCASKIEAAARKTSGIVDAAVSVTGGTVTLKHVAAADLAQFQRRAEGMGYRVTPDTMSPSQKPASHSELPDSQPWWQTGKAKLTLACAIALAFAFAAEQFIPALHPWGFIAAVLVGLIPIAGRAFAAARLGLPFSIETLMTVAAVGAIIIGASAEAAVVVVLFLVGELLEGLAAGRARASIRALADLVPRTALREHNGQTREIPADELATGDIVIVRPGDRIPADGEIVSGESAIDEAPVTGESVLKAKAVGDNVFAGTINHESVLRISVTAIAADNTIARVIHLVEEAQEAKAPTERFIDSFSKFYTPAIMLVALLVAVFPPLAFGASWEEWIYKALALLLIGCPCALVISTPAAIAAALSAGARNGLLVKGGGVLETLGKVDRVGFDKTGTLTQGKPVVTDIMAVNGDEDDVLRLAAALEAGSSHPLALAIIERAKAVNLVGLPATDAKTIGGKGVTGKIGNRAVFLGSPRAAEEQADLPKSLQSRISALNEEGKTVSVLVVEGTAAGLIAMRDAPRETAAAGVAALKALGVTPAMLTGDNRRTAEAVAADLGIAAHAELLPADKQAIVKTWQSQGHIVAKVGDGINDAPALAAADVGIAMGEGTDIALETADAAILNSRVEGVAGMIGLSRSAIANIKQNITIALGLKAVFLVTTLLGITGLWPAILADTGATVLVTANAMRLLAWRMDD